MAQQQINLSGVSILVCDTNQSGLTILTQLLRSFGADTISTALDLDTVEKRMSEREIDLLLLDPRATASAGMNGFQFLRALRRSGKPHRDLPTMLLLGHTTKCDVLQSRDCGADMVVAKPVSATILLHRLVWMTQRRRAFIETPTYVGPDRRFRCQGPPPGCEGRREGDRVEALSESGPNLSQDQINFLIKPQKVSL